MSEASFWRVEYYDEQIWCMSKGAFTTKEEVIACVTLLKMQGINTISIIEFGQLANYGWIYTPERAEKWMSSQ